MPRAPRKIDGRRAYTRWFSSGAPQRFAWAASTFST
jgi:hypothetical protein